MARATGLSKDTINRIWRAFRLKPHRQKYFPLSTDPLFVDKARDIVGLYLDPPDKALLSGVDEKNQIQALDWTQPVLPLGPGYLEGVTHHYIRRGTSTLFAALDLASGKVLTQCKPRRRQQDLLQFLRHIDANVPKDLDIHLIVDDYATHKSQTVRDWLAKRPRYHVHYTPTYASCLNQVETCSVLSNAKRSGEAHSTVSRTLSSRSLRSSRSITPGASPLPGIPPQTPYSEE